MTILIRRSLPTVPLTFVGDMTRRAIRAVLDAGVERPELRAFDRDPLSLTEAPRGAYITQG